MYQRGFTLIELLLVLAAGIASLTLSVQTFKQLTERRLLIQPTEKILKSLRFARATAVGGRRDVSLCPSKDQSSCASSTGYESGWIVFADSDNSGHRTPDEPLLTTQSSLASRITLRSNTFSAFITFRADGRANTNGSFAICADESPGNAVGVLVIRSGRPRKVPSDKVKRCLT